MMPGWRCIPASASPSTTSKANSAYFLCKQADSGLDCSQIGTASASLDTSVPVAWKLGWIPISRVAAGAQASVEKVILGEFFNKGV